FVSTIVCIVDDDEGDTGAMRGLGLGLSAGLGLGGRSVRGVGARGTGVAGGGLGNSAVGVVELTAGCHADRSRKLGVPLRASGPGSASAFIMSRAVRGRLSASRASARITTSAVWLDTPGLRSRKGGKMRG